MIPIVFTIDTQFCPPAYIAIKSLIDAANEDTVYEIIIYHWKISPILLRCFNRLVEGKRHSIRCIPANKEQFRGYPITHTWPYSAYLRLLLPEVLLDYNKVIYSDVDVFFKGDLTELYHTSLVESELGAVPAESKESAQNHQVYEEYRNDKIYWSGLLVMNLSLLRERQMCEQIDYYIKKYRDKLRMFDLELLNMICNRITDLPLRYVMLQDLYDQRDIENTNDYKWLSRLHEKSLIIEEKERTVIIHYAGKHGKPWLRKDIPNYYRRYMEGLPLVYKVLNKYNRMEQRVRTVLKVAKRKLWNRKK